MKSHNNWNHNWCTTLAALIPFVLEALSESINSFFTELTLQRISRSATKLFLRHISDGELETQTNSSAVASLSYSMLRIPKPKLFYKNSISQNGESYSFRPFVRIRAFPLHIPKNRKKWWPNIISTKKFRWNIPICYDHIFQIELQWVNIVWGMQWLLCSKSFASIRFQFMEMEVSGYISRWHWTHSHMNFSPSVHWLIFLL